MSYISLNNENLKDEHICCGISDKKCKESYEMKKSWLSVRLDEGYVFRKLDERAKVFIEYGPAEYAWVPVEAPGYLMLGCFWVSGRFKKMGHAKALLESAVEDAKRQGRQGVAAICGRKKFHFMSDGAWLKRQGFHVADSTEDGFELLVMNFENTSAETGANDSPVFHKSARLGRHEVSEGLAVVYSSRCVFTDYHVNKSLVESAEKRGIPLHITKLESREQARNACTPATIFSLFYDGNFITTDVSACMDSRLDKVLKNAGISGYQ